MGMGASYYVCPYSMISDSNFVFLDDAGTVKSSAPSKV